MSNMGLSQKQRVLMKAMVAVLMAVIMTLSIDIPLGNAREVKSGIASSSVEAKYLKNSCWFNDKGSWLKFDDAIEDEDRIRGTFVNCAAGFSCQGEPVNVVARVPGNSTNPYTDAGAFTANFLENGCANSVTTWKIKEIRSQSPPRMDAPWILTTAVLKQPSNFTNVIGVDKFSKVSAAACKMQCTGSER